MEFSSLKLLVVNEEIVNLKAQAGGTFDPV